MDLILFPKNTSESIGEYAYRVLRKNIIQINLKPGFCLSPVEVAQVLHASRTPIHGAFARLMSDGLVDIFPQKGSYVSMIDMKRVYESIYMRNLLDQAVIRILCEKDIPEEGIVQLEANLQHQQFCHEKNLLDDVFELDNHFHESLYTLAGMEYLQQALQSIVADQHRVRFLKLHSHLRWEETMDEHRMLIQAIREKNVELGCRQSYEHVARFAVDIKSAYDQQPEFFTNWDDSYSQKFSFKLDAFYNMRNQ